MTIMINVSNTVSHKVDLELLEKAIRITLETHNKADTDLTLQITNDETIRQLNNAYRGVNEATDVLAFNQDFINPETNQLYLGDIIISIDRASIQALENSHTINKECALLTIHGTLHLLGYDHSNEQEKLAMWKIQDKILQNLMLQ
jgi:probable rRNA maturation factor